MLWLHPAVVVGPSPIAGAGLFTTMALAEATIVSIVDGTVLGGIELAEFIAAENRHGRYVDTITIGPDRHLVLPPDTPNGKGNHSCDPNLWWVDAVTLAARRDIAAGDELTNDYATSTAESGFSMPCRCAATTCRGVVTGDDWRRPELRHRYGEHWAAACRGTLPTSEV